MSTFVCSDVVFELGNLHHGRKRVQPLSREIREFYEAASSRLKFPLLKFERGHLFKIASAFARVIAQERYTCYACALMPDHVHLLIRKHKHLAEEMIENFQEESRAELLRVRLRPELHPVWGGQGWKVFLDSPDDVRRTIEYIEDNPVQIRCPRQKWEFVAEYDGWPLHPGHDPNSPYARRLGGR
jgi:REP element-mobilizing transposase RayT